MSNSEGDDKNSNVEVSGIGNAVAIGKNSRAFAKNTIVYPYGKILFAELITVLVLQVPINLIMLFSLLTVFPLFLLIAVYVALPWTCCSTVPISINSIYAFTMGIMRKDRKVVILSMISGLLDLSTIVMYIMTSFRFGNHYGI